jgi:membrane-associated phospholipid phosphatase
MYKFIVSLLLLCLIISVSARVKAVNDSLVRKAPISLRSQIIPLSLMATSGVILATNSKRYIQGAFGDLSETNIDDYFQYIPVCSVFAAHFIGLKHKNSLWNTSKYIVLSQITTSIIVHTLKRTTDLPRPDGGRYTFPSGHTSQTFVGAAALYHEFKDFHPYFAYCGYAFAFVVGSMRVTNYRHWAPDVLFAAGLGILVTNIVYYYEPFKNWNPFKGKKYSIRPGLDFYGSTALASLNLTF